MNLAAIDNKETLDAVAVAFENYRNSSGAGYVRYPDSLKLRAVNLVKSGFSIPSVAKACGLGKTTIFYWLKLRPVKAEKPMARRLEVVTEPIVNNLPNECIFRAVNGLVLETNKETAAWLLLKLGGKQC